MAPLIVVTGPTASGKSSLAMKLAKKWGGEIICADSRTVYKDMDIGTAKPSADDRLAVKHWLLDVVEPGQRFTAHDFQKLANEAILDIRRRNKIPFLVGGTGLYLDSVVLGFSFGPDVDLERRKILSDMSVEQLQQMHKSQHINLPSNHKNRRHLIRSIEKNNNTQSVDNKISDNAYVVAINTTIAELEIRIKSRVNYMFDQSVLQETQHLIDKYGIDCEAMTGNIYRILGRVIKGEISEPEARSLAELRDRQLAKRQITWLKRHDWVRWMTPEYAEQYLDNILRVFRDGYR